MHKCKVSFVFLETDYCFNIVLVRDGLGVKKRPWIFSQIGPPQLQTAATISQCYSNQCIAFMANNIKKTMVTLLKKTIETITEILMVSTTNAITNITQTINF